MTSRIRRRLAGTSLTARLILFGLLALLPALGVIVYQETELRRTRESEIADAVARQTQQASAEMARFVEGRRMLLAAVAASPVVRRLEVEECNAFLAELARSTPSARAILVIDLDGRLRCRHAPLDTATNYADRDYFRLALEQRDFVVGTLTRPRNDPARTVLPFATPVLGADGEPVAVAVTSVDTSYLNGLIDGWALGRGGNLTIADRDGVILARNPLPERFVGNRIPDQYQAWVRGTRPGLDRAMSQDGTRRIIAYKPASLPPNGLYISTGLSEGEAFEAIDGARRAGLIVIGAAGLLALLGAWWAGRVFVRRPVRQLLDLADAWRRGRRADGSERPERPSGREFAAIADALDRMGGELAERETAARQSEERLRRTIRAAPHPLMLHAEDGEILEVSESWSTLSGYPREALRRVSEWTRRALVAGPDGARDPVLEPFSVDEHVSGLERRVRAGDGRERIWDFSVVPLEPLADGRKLRLTAAVDVTDRYRNAEQQTLLLRELDHRVKNTLATVQSIAAQTFRATPDPAHFVKSLSERLGSLARTHDTLTRGHWRGASLGGLVEAELAHVPGHERISIAGPEVTLPAEMAVPVGLILHELATNAIKYGALGAADGRLTVHWTKPDPATGQAVLTWTESDGPAVSPPGRPGFGSRLIAQLSRAVGEGETNFPPEGLAFRLRLDLAHGAPPDRSAGAPASNAAQADPVALPAQ